MTTIATDGRSIAADGLVVLGSEVVSRDAKKLQVVDYERSGRHGPPVVYGIAGPIAMFSALIAWHESGADPRGVPPGELDWSLVVARRGLVQLYSRACPWPQKLGPNAAVGSGEDLALGAMLAGASPREAVAIAAGVDIRSGGAIQVIDLATGESTSDGDIIIDGLTTHDSPLTIHA